VAVCIHHYYKIDIVTHCRIWLAVKAANANIDVDFYCESKTLTAKLWLISKKYAATHSL
jgi:hypothetical protein